MDIYITDALGCGMRISPPWNFSNIASLALTEDVNTN